MDAREVPQVDVRVDERQIVHHPPLPSPGCCRWRFSNKPRLLPVAFSSKPRLLPVA
jgi:hypothetical protein